MLIYKMKFTNNREFGSWGEKQAEEYLLDKGYQLVERNFRVRQGEIDLIVKNDQFLVFVEVKTRKNNLFGAPQAAVDYRKQNKIKKIAKFYLRDKKYIEYKLRFDVISILYKNDDNDIVLEHYKNSF